ncbi:unnamed protein product [Adineta steineri]|uniref:Uncharacterized protein n=1 Tax=Adineta steineri TaxID=433720 RepID=A0A814RJ73_9BILA|nr:unnamed protein product [Adineta steineri]CAF1130808.1 unnamed protein product [Adineta steineri]CAF1132953.1 unnamed protein product [Adineta steineri]CAF3504926.1 unnamed protein product [Adineta steineri]CAF3519074.1 unnamed protein product [Adineta steineri]
MAEVKEENKISLSTIIIVALLIIVIAGVTIAIPILYTAKSNTGPVDNTTNTNAPTNYTQNECTQSFSKTQVLNYIVDAEPFPYRLYNLIFRPSVIAKSMSLVFGFRHDTASWSLDKISVIDTTMLTETIIDGSFESNYLTKNYYQCILSNTRNSVSDILFDIPYDQDFYYNDQTNVGMTYLIQTLSITGGRYYNITFYLENRGYKENAFVILVGS